MPPFVWLVVCAYLVVAAVCLLEADFTIHRPGPLGSARICLAALVFAAGWPLRVAAWTFRRLS